MGRTLTWAGEGCEVNESETGSIGGCECDLLNCFAGFFLAFLDVGTRFAYVVVR